MGTKIRPIVFKINTKDYPSTVDYIVGTDPYVAYYPISDIDMNGVYSLINYSEEATRADLIAYDEEYTFLGMLGSIQPISDTKDMSTISPYLPSNAVYLGVRTSDSSYNSVALTDNMKLSKQ